MGKEAFFISTILFSSFLYAQTEVDTIYNEKGNVDAYGEMRDGKRYGVWYFNFRNGKSYKTINYLANNEALVKYFSDEDLVWGVDQDAMRMYPSYRIENNKFYLSKYHNAKYDPQNYEVVFDGLTHYYYPTTGTIMVGHFKNGKMDGEWKSRYPSGYIMNRKNFKNGILDGIWITYYEEPNKQKWIEGQYQQNAKKGIWKEYYPNGQLKQEGAFNIDLEAVHITDKNIDSLQILYPDTELQYYQSAKFPLNFKSGCWKYYSEKGELAKTEYYEKGQLVKTK